MTEPLHSEFIDSLQAAFQQGDERVDDKLEEAENVRRVQEVFRILAREDYAALGDVLAEDVTFEIVGSPATPLAGRTQGRQQVIEATRNNFAQIEGQRPEVESVVAQGDSVIVVGKEQGRFRPTGRDYTLHWIYVYRFKEGKVISVRELFDSAALLEVMQPE